MDKRILAVEKEGMFIGVSTRPECWKNPMNVNSFIEEAENE